MMALLWASLTVWCIWAGTRFLFGEHVALGTALVTAVHRQFVLMSTAVNAAVVVNLCAAVMWWWAARMRVEGFSVSGSVVLVGAALVGQTGGRPAVGDARRHSPRCDAHRPR